MTSTTTRLPLTDASPGSPIWMCRAYLGKVSHVSGLQGFEALSGRLDYPMAVVTLQVDGKRAGCLVGFATQCSIDPVRYLVCLSHKNHTYRVAQQGVQRLAVHLLEPDQTDLAAL